MSAKILLRKTSLVDYPGRISSVLFFYGCNLRCPWCHNHELFEATGEVDPDSLVTFEGALTHIRKRRSVLGGVVLSGGEPCCQAELPDIIREIKKLSLPVKLDTNGMFPAMLKELFNSKETKPDFIALDLKIAPYRYGELIALEKVKNHGAARSFNKTSPASSVKLDDEIPDNLIQSAALIREAGIEHEYRSLALPGGYFTEKDIEALAPLTDTAPWHFRPFRGGNCLDPAWDKLEEPVAEARARAEVLAAKARELGKNGLCL